MLRKVALVGLVMCWLAHAARAETTHSNCWSDLGYGSLAMVTNLVYMPTKLVYGLIGTVTGGLAYLVTVGNADVAQSVWDPSVGGTYIITQAMLRGEDPILFNGPSYSKD